MKNRIVSVVLMLSLAVSALTACGSSDSNGLDTGKNAAKTEAVVANDTEKALAKELLDRSATPEDKITDGVVNEVIALLKDKYTFEKVGTIYVEGDNSVYAAQGKGWFKNLFGDSGIEVQIQQSVDDDEPSLMERGELHFANRMLYPYLIDKKNDPENKLVAVWNSDNPPAEIVTVVARSDSDYKCFADLKGKKIASSAAGCPYSTLIELAANQGWEYNVDYEHVNTKEYTAALLAGEVDAIVYHPSSVVAPLLLSGEGKIIDTAIDGGVYQSGGGDRVIFAPTQYVKDNPNVTHAYVKLNDVVGAWVEQNAKEAADVEEAIDRVPAESTEFWINSSGGTLYTSPDSLNDLKDNARSFSEWLVENDKNFEHPIDVENGFFAEEFFDVG